MSTTDDATYCRICEAACGLVAQRDAGGRLSALRPDREHPLSRGFVCAKGLRFLEVARDPERLRHPLARTPDGGTRALSWPEARRALTARLRPIVERHGPHAVAVYLGNPMAFCTLGALSTWAFVRRLGTRNFYSSASQDCANKFAGANELHGSPVIHPIPDFEHTDLAVLFGTNPMVSQSSFVHLPEGARVFDRLQARGGAVICVDPRRTESAARWDHHVPIRAGTDVVLLLGLLRHFGRAAAGSLRPEHQVGLERLLALADTYPLARVATLTGLSEVQIDGLITRIAHAPRVAFHMSVGVNQGPFGTLAYVVLQALAYVTGNLDREGGLLFSPWARAAARGAAWLGIDRRGQQSRVGGFETTLDFLPGAVLAEEILTDGPERVRALICVGGDPVRSMPGSDRLREALARLDVLVGVDLFANETTARADFLLPAASWLERWDVAGASFLLQTGDLLQTAAPLQEPPEECRPEQAILADLSLAVGRPLLGTAWLTAFVRDLPLDRWLGTALRWMQRLWGATFPHLRYGVPLRGPRPGRYLGRGPLTEGRLLRFWTPALARETQRLAQMPESTTGSGRQSSTLLLTGRRRRIGHNSWLHGGTRVRDEVEEAWLAPADCARLGVPLTGGRVRLRHKESSIDIAARADESVSVGHVVVPHGLRGVNVNRLVPSGVDAVERISGQHWMTGVPVECVVVAEPSRLLLEDREDLKQAMAPLAAKE